MIINDRKYDLKFTGKTLFIYKEEFHEDLLSSLSKFDMADSLSALKIIWAMIKTCDKTLPHCDEWLDQFSMSELTKMLNGEIVTEIMDVIGLDSKHTKELKKK